MTEPNPYEAPQAAEPLSVGTAAKRAGGIGLILLLTPPAVFIAFGGSCAAALLTPDVSSPSIGYAIGFLMFLGIPWGVLVAMTSWAAWRHYRSTESHERRGRITILLLTPIVVAGAIWLGFAATNVPASDRNALRDAAACTRRHALPGLALRSHSDLTQWARVSDPAQGSDRRSRRSPEDMSGESRLRMDFY